LYKQEIFPNWRKVKNVDEQMATIRCHSISIEGYHDQIQEQISSNEEASRKEMLFRISRNSPASEDIRRTNVGLDKEWSVERNTIRAIIIYKSRSFSTESEWENEIGNGYASSEFVCTIYISRWRIL
jgi:hypothetical protein